MGLRDIIKTQGSGLGRVVGYPPSLNSAHNAAALLSLAHSLLSLLALDRFGDYNADQVVAPVRETAAQTLASVMMHMGEEEVRSVHGVLVRMVNQEASRSAEGGTKGVKEKGYAWEVRHAGLLGLKYEVAVRGDLVGRKDDSGVGKAVKEEPIEMVKLEVKEEVEPEGSVGLGATVNQSGIGGLAENDARKSAMLKDVVDAAVLGSASLCSQLPYSILRLV
jgi:TATA-binding protein-associated factor